MTPEQIQSAIESLLIVGREIQEAQLRTDAQIAEMRSGIQEMRSGIQEAQLKTDAQIAEMTRGIQEFKARAIARDIQDVSNRIVTDSIIKRINESDREVIDRLKIIEDKLN